jgi:hypothetical protein
MFNRKLQIRLLRLESTERAQFFGKLKIALSFHINVNELLYRPKQLAKKKGKLDKRDLNENNFQWRDFIFIGNS